MAYLANQPACDRVQHLIVGALRAQTPMLITAVNLGEVWYSIARRWSESAADDTVAGLRRLGFQVRNPDWELTREAARLKARYRIAYADCFAAALARQLGAELVTGDPEFRRLEEEVRIRWL